MISNRILFFTIKLVWVDILNDTIFCLAKESAINEGKRITFPLKDETEADARTRNSLKREYGVDPMDVEAMLATSYPKP